MWAIHRLAGLIAANQELNLIFRLNKQIKEGENEKGETVALVPYAWRDDDDDYDDFT